MACNYSIRCGPNWKSTGYNYWLSSWNNNHSSLHIKFDGKIPIECRGADHSRFETNCEGSISRQSDLQRFHPKQRYWQPNSKQLGPKSRTVEKTAKFQSFKYHLRKWCWYFGKYDSSIEWWVRHQQLWFSNHNVWKREYHTKQPSNDQNWWKWKKLGKPKWKLSDRLYGTIIL